MSVDSLIGKILGGHRITRKIGEGGMGVVYEAEHNLIGRRAAIKCLLPELSANAEACGRFFIEARAAALTSHPSLVDIYDSGHTEEDATGRRSAYIIMEYLDGEDLGSYLRREHKMPLGMTVAICRQVASALGAVHQKGIVHRDLKPDNLFLVKTGQANTFRVKVLDFGIAKLTGPENKELSVKTRTGSVLGTPSYMSPEQCRGHGKVDSRSDVYALGCIMFEMLIGHPPFQGSGYGEVLAQHIYEPPTPLRQLDPSLPEGIEQLVGRMLQKNPEQRLPSMEEFASSLDSLANIPAMVSASGSGGARIETSGAFPMPRSTPFGLSASVAVVSVSSTPVPQGGLAAASSSAAPAVDSASPGPPEKTNTTFRGAASEKVAKPGKRGFGIPIAIGGAVILAVGAIAMATHTPSPPLPPSPRDNVAVARPGDPSPTAATSPPDNAAVARPQDPAPLPTPAVVETKPNPTPPPPAPEVKPPVEEVKVAALPSRPVEAAPTPPEPVKAEPVKAEPAKPEPAKAEPAKTEVVQTAPTAPEPVAFHVDSDPAGADVLRDGKSVGKTPFDTTLPPAKGAKVAFTLAMKGYKDAKIELPGDKGGKASTKLVAIPEPKVAEASPSKPSESKPPAIRTNTTPAKPTKGVGDKLVKPKF